MASVHALFIAVVHRQPMLPIDPAPIVGSGIKGCIHGRVASRRQVLLMDLETLNRLDLTPGILKENVTTTGLDVAALKEGARLRIGTATLEVTGPCHPCHLMDEIRPGLKEELRGRRGALCRVVHEGEMHRGDSIEVLDYARVGE